MDVLVLGGTAWLGRETAAAAVARGHAVTCLARGGSGDVALGARLVVADRERDDAYDAVRGVAWDAVIDVSWQPKFVRSAVDALADSAGHWLLVSSGSVYAGTAEVDTDESALLLPAFIGDVVGDDDYGEAKVACELACRRQVGDRLLIARAGVIAGPGDTSDRCGYWVARAARAPEEPMLAPAEQGCPVQMVDVRDLAAWFIHAAEDGVVGTFNAVGPPAAVLRVVTDLPPCRRPHRRRGHGVHRLVDRTRPRLLRRPRIDRHVWLLNPGMYGFFARNGDAARVAGLRCRPVKATLTDVLLDERHRGLDRSRDSGLSPHKERQLLARA